MKTPAVVADALGRVQGMLHRALDGLTSEELHRQPGPESNPIGWLVWHLTRGQDRQVANLAGLEQVWVREGWNQCFSMPADPEDMGTGHTLEQVIAFHAPDVQALLDYHDAVYEQTKTYLAGIPEQELVRVLNEPRYQPPPTVGVRLVSIISDNMQHAGQVAYLRGYVRGKGWFPA